MKARLVLFALAAVVLLGGVTTATVAIGPSCPSGSYRNRGPTTEPSQTGTIPIPTCTSYATHAAPSSGVVIPRYATGMDAHVAERLGIAIASIVFGALLAGLAWSRGRRRTDETEMSAASA